MVRCILWFGQQLGMPGCDALLGPVLLRKHQGAASHCLNGWFGDDQLRMQHSWNTRSIRRKCPLSTFSTCPRSCRARHAAETDFQEVLAAGRIFEVSEIVPGAQGAGMMAEQGCAHRYASWPGRKLQALSTKAAVEDSGSRWPSEGTCLVSALPRSGRAFCWFAVSQQLLEPVAADRIISMILGSLALRSWQLLSRACGLG